MTSNRLLANSLRKYLRRTTILAAMLFFVMFSMAAGAEENVKVTEIASNVIVFSTSTGNVVASVGSDGALLVGTPSASSTQQINSILKSRTKSVFRYVVIGPEPEDESQGDAGWGQLGAFVAMQENALHRLGGSMMGKSAPLPASFIKLGVERPHIAFSEVLSFDLNGEAIHIVHQAPGYSNADTITHFHVANVVYLGEVFPGDGYPKIDPAQGGTLAGLLKTLESWTGSQFRIVPARGEVTNGATVKAFLDMISTVRDRIKRLIKEGKMEAQIVAAHPTSDFDKRWGNGRISPDLFVHEIYSGLKQPLPSQKSKKPASQ